MRVACRSSGSSCGDSVLVCGWDCEVRHARNKKARGEREKRECWFSSTSTGVVLDSSIWPGALPWKMGVCLCLGEMVWLWEV